MALHNQQNPARHQSAQPTILATTVTVPVLLQRNLTDIAQSSIKQTPSSERER
jgi:hypothetical protein